LEKPDFSRAGIPKCREYVEAFLLKAGAMRRLHAAIRAFARAANDPHLPLFQYSLTVGTIEHGILMTKPENIF